MSAPTLEQPALRPFAELADLPNKATARRNLGTGPTVAVGSDLATDGDGSPSNPFIGWAAKLNASWSADTTYEFTPAGHYSAEVGLVATGDALSGITLDLKGGTVTYTGAGTISTFIDFVGDIFQYGQRNNHVINGNLDLGGKVMTWGVRSRCSHYFGLQDLHLRNAGSSSCYAWRVEGCTFAWAERSTCSTFYNTGGAAPNIDNTFAGGVSVDMVAETGNSTSGMILKQCDFKGVTGTAAINLVNCFNFLMIGGSAEANPNGPGLSVGSNVLGALFLYVDFEANGANTADIGGGYRRGVYINGQQIVLKGCKSFGLGVAIDSAAVGTRFEDMPIDRVEFNRGNNSSAENCPGAWQLDPTVSANNTDLNFHGHNNWGGGAVAATSVPAMTVRGQLNAGSVVLPWGSDVDLLKMPFQDGSLFQAGIRSDDDPRTLRIYFKASDNRGAIDLQTGSGTNVLTRLHVADTVVQASVPVQVPQYTVASLPSASTSGKGATAFATNGRKSGESAGNGTGVPVCSDGTSWRTYFDNSIVAA